MCDVVCGGSTSVTTAALQLLGIPAYAEGNLIHLDSVTLGVTEACSGIRSLVTLLAGSVALAWLLHEKRWQRVVLLASVVPIAMSSQPSRSKSSTASW